MTDPSGDFVSRLASGVELGAILAMVSVASAAQTRTGKIAFALAAALAFGGVIR